MKKMLDREELERLMEEFLQKEPLCVIVTCSHDIPRASCVKLFPLGATLYILTEGGRRWKISGIILWSLSRCTALFQDGSA